MAKAGTTYILLFRGVGGATQLPTAPLRAALTEAGFADVATYINSGNAVVRSGLAREEVVASVAKICAERFGFAKAIHAPTLAEWEDLIANNPFPGYEAGKHVHAAVLAGDPAEGAVEGLRKYAVEGEAVEVVGRVAYLHTPHGLGTSKLGEKFDRGIGVANTARNWNTVLKLRDLARKAAGSGPTPATTPEPPAPEAVAGPIFFESPDAFRSWLVENHAAAAVVLVGYHKKGTGRPSLTWPESVDEALCFGWIDGVRRSFDGERYTVRFTPRKRGSIWSSVNVGRVRALTELGRMRPAGLAAFEARTEGRSGLYSHEQGDVELPEPYLGLLRAHPAAWAFYQEQPASYRKAANWWVAGAKQEATRRKRLDRLVEHSARAERVPQFAWRKSSG